MSRFLFSISILFIFTIPAVSADLRLAVLDLSAVNVPDFYAGTVRDRVEVSLYKSNKIELLERNKVQLVLKEHNLISGACKDDSCAVQIGKFLSATHVIVGNVSYLDRYTITLRVVDVARGKIVYADTESVPARPQIDGASIKIAARILEHIEGIHTDSSLSSKHLFILSIEGGYVQPIGVFSRIARSGYSISLTGAVNNVGVNNLYLGLKGGFNRFWGKDDVNYSYIVPFTALIGYTFNLPKSFFISPALAAGGSWNYMKKDRSNSKGIIEPVINPELSIGYRIIPMLNIYFTTNYYAIFEQRAIIQFLAFNLGLSFSFN
ncbi:MAG TPA: CsgG/HfaB family protein [Spirochaetota bacterium]|nr:CsgG/HfaB family protein [Spirochaetota bacterium]HPV42204.1 CsgG/HfaB family protein [Spirochaetota bacterium]